jgi:hypothetical protein
MKKNAKPEHRPKALAVQYLWIYTQTGVCFEEEEKNAAGSSSSGSVLER